MTSSHVFVCTSDGIEIYSNNAVVKATHHAGLRDPVNLLVIFILSSLAAQYFKICSRYALVQSFCVLSIEC